MAFFSTNSAISLAVSIVSISISLYLKGFPRPPFLDFLLDLPLEPRAVSVFQSDDGLQAEPIDRIHGSEVQACAFQNGIKVIGHGVFHIDVSQNGRDCKESYSLTGVPQTIATKANGKHYLLIACAGELQEAVIFRIVLAVKQ